MGWSITSNNVATLNSCFGNDTTTPSTPNVAISNNYSRSSIVAPSTPNATMIMAQVLPIFNPIIKFSRELHTNYQGVKIEKLCIL
jgi:hypothetical protein